MKENPIKMPQPRPTSNGVIGVEDSTLPRSTLTHPTSKTGAVFSSVTAKVAPVSLTLLVKTMIAPANNEYLVKGRTIVLNTVNGRPPKVLDASSKFMFNLSMAATIDLTK